MRWALQSIRVNAVLNKISKFFFAEIAQLILKFLWKCKGPKIVKTTLKKKNKTGGFTLPDFKTYKAIVHKTTWYWHQDRQIDQWNVMESPEVNTTSVDNWFFKNKGTKTMWWWKHSPLNKWWWNDCLSICEITNLDPYLT